MSAVAADLPLLARSLLALAGVLALLLGARWMLTRKGMGAMRPARRGGGLHLVETLHLDTRNRLVLIRRGDAELLLAVGPQGVTGLDRAASPDWSLRPETVPVP